MKAMITCMVVLRGLLRATTILAAFFIASSQSYFSSDASAQILTHPRDTDSDGVPDTQETQDGTNAIVSDSVIEHVGSEYCVDWNGFISEDMQAMELRNAGCSTLTIQIVLRDSKGAVQGTQTRSLEASKQFDVVANLFSGFLPNSYGSLCADILSGDPDTLDVRMSTYRMSGGTFSRAFSTAAAVARSGPQFVGFNNYFPSFDPSESTSRAEGWVQVSNEDSSPSGGELVYYSGAGNELKRISISVPAFGRFDADTHSIGRNSVGLVEWRPDSSTKKFRVVLNRYYSRDAVGGDYAGIVGLTARRPSGYSLAGTFGTGTRRLAVLELSNALDIETNVTVSVYDASGSLTATQPKTVRLPAKGTEHLILNDYLSSGLGKVEIDADLAQSVVSSVFEYGLNLRFGFSFANVGEPKAGFGITQRSSYNSYLGGCRLRVANLSNTTQSTQISLNRGDGTSVSFPGPIQVPANGISDLDLCGSDAPGNYGSVVLTPSSTESLVAEVIRENADKSSEFKTTASERSGCSAGLRLNTPSLSLIASSGTPGTVSVSNDSTAVIATNIRAVLPSGWGDVTVDATNCANLNPGASCTVSFTPGSSIHAAASVSLLGDNTNELLPTLTVDPSPTAVITVTGSPLGLTTNSSSESLTISNTSLTTTALNIGSSFSGTALSGLVTETGNTCASLAPLGSCTLTFTPGGSAVSQTSFAIQGTNTNSVSAAISISPPPMTTLSTSVSDLALSVTGYTEYGVSGSPSSGVARLITITNVGTLTASGFNIVYPTWPAGTTASSTCGSTLSAGSSCQITVTPGSVATSDGTNPSTIGTAPIPGVISISGSNTNTVTTNVVVLGYSSVWQGGYVFAFDDTTANTGSVGGKVASTTDQAPAFPSGIIWASDGTSGSVAYDTIYGISEVSTTSSSDPSSGQVAGQAACNGNSDGACNTNNIYIYYQNFATGAPVAASFYATGLCKATISGYSDWYLPAICEMGTNAASGCGVSHTPTLQNMQSGLVDFNTNNFLAGYYWASTELSAAPNLYVWLHFFAPSGGSFQVDGVKATLAGVRCVRSLTP